MTEAAPQPIQQHPAMVAPGQQVAYQSPPVHQPIQYGYVATPGQPIPISGPSGQQPVPYYVPAPANKPQRSPIHLTLDFAFLKTQAGVFKLIEIVTIIIALSCVMHYKEITSLPNSTRMEDNSDLDFFVGSLESAWVMVILVTFSFIIGLRNACGAQQHFHTTVTVFHVLWALLLLISSGLMARQASDWRDWIDVFKKEDRIRLTMLFVAVAFGFISFIFLVLNAVLHGRFYSALRNQEPRYAVQAHPGVQQPVMQAHPGVQQPMMQAHPGVQQS